MIKTYATWLAVVLTIETLQQVFDHILSVGNVLQTTLLNGYCRLKEFKLVLVE